ncbi:MAG: hypothetical protein ACRERC_24665 [Candidatus Binatia bacterium]
MIHETPTPRAPQDFALQPDHLLHRGQRAMLGAGVLALLATGAGGLVDHVQFFRSYLVAYMFWAGIALGSLALVALNHISGGRWGVVIRRICEAAMRTLPLLALLFVPIVFGLTDLYEWARPEVVAHDPLLQHKAAYLNVPFFLIRVVIYFAVWIVVAHYLMRWSLEQDRTDDPDLVRRLQLLGRGGLLLYSLTMTFAAIDWAMSLEPHWYSTIYGILIIGGQVLSAFAFVIPVLMMISDRPPLSEVVTAEQFHDLGKLLLAFVMLYAYFAFSQFLIIWSANLPEEVPWYLKRLAGGWQWVAIALVFFHFALPFTILLSRDLKRNARRLAVVAFIVLLARLVDLNWLITPAFSPGRVTVHWMDFAAVLGVGGIWLSMFLWQLRDRPLVPLHDPALPVATVSA